MRSYGGLCGPLASALVSSSAASTVWPSSSRLCLRKLTVRSSSSTTRMFTWPSSTPTAACRPPRRWSMVVTVRPYKTAPLSYPNLESTLLFHGDHDRRPRPRLRRPGLARRGALGRCPRPPRLRNPPDRRRDPGPAGGRPADLQPDRRRFRSPPVPRSEEHTAEL